METRDGIRVGGYYHFGGEMKEKMVPFVHFPLFADRSRVQKGVFAGRVPRKGIGVGFFHVFLRCARVG